MFWKNEWLDVRDVGPVYWYNVSWYTRRRSNVQQTDNSNQIALAIFVTKLTQPQKKGPVNNDNIVAHIIYDQISEMILGIQPRAVATAALRRTTWWHPSRHPHVVAAVGRRSLSSSHWTSYEMAPPDPIIGLNEAYQKDTHPNKVIVGVGAYRDDHGKPYVLPSVRIAEQRMMDQKLDMEYSGIVRIILHGRKITI